MKLLITYCEDREGTVWSIDHKLTLDDGGHISLHFNDCSECPEDATFGRDLNDVHSLENALRMAYQAGQRGEKFEVETEITGY
ncbi:MAG: hypothetical protein NC218_03795 [Acetobacter sp.]|nr:hypothetical protein [Acetobacter sp.]